MAENTNLTKLVRAAMFAALAVGLGYSLMLVPNVELITVIIFLSGLTLGIRWGILVGAVSEFIFSAMNPLGSSLMFPPLIAAQIISMIIVGLAGGLLRPVFFKKKLSFFRIVTIGLTGFLLTFIFDSLTTLSYPIGSGFDWPQIWGIYLSGIGFTIVHQLSNGFIFAVSVPGVVKYLS